MARRKIGQGSASPAGLSLARDRTLGVVRVGKGQSVRRRSQGLPEIFDQRRIENGEQSLCKTQVKLPICTIYEKAGGEYK